MTIALINLQPKAEGGDNGLEAFQKINSLISLVNSFGNIVSLNTGTNEGNIPVLEFGGLINHERIPKATDLQVRQKSNNAFMTPEKTIKYLIAHSLIIG